MPPNDCQDRAQLLGQRVQGERLGCVDLLREADRDGGQGRRRRVQLFEVAEGGYVVKDPGPDKTGGRVVGERVGLVVLVLVGAEGQQPGGADLERRGDRHQVVHVHPPGAALDLPEDRRAHGPAAGGDPGGEGALVSRPLMSQLAHQCRQVLADGAELEWRDAIREPPAGSWAARPAIMAALRRAGEGKIKASC